MGDGVGGMSAGGPEGRKQKENKRGLSSPPAPPTHHPLTTPEDTLVTGGRRRQTGKFFSFSPVLVRQHCRSTHESVKAFTVAIARAVTDGSRISFGPADSSVSPCSGE